MKQLGRLIILTVCLATISHLSFAQCNVELYSKRSMKLIKGNYMFMKSFRIDGKGGARRKIEYTCVFSKGISYEIHVTSKSGNSDGIVATLYNPDRRKLASNFFESKFFQTMRYDCRATGIYYLSFTFRESDAFCGAAILSFKKL